MTEVGSRHGARLLIPTVVVGLFLLNAWSLRHYRVDDAFISFRYARNIASGLGPVFNAGERIEGYSNPFYTFLLAGTMKILRNPDDLPDAARAIGVGASLLTLLLLSRFPGGRSTWGRDLALLLTATSASFCLWAVAGLETPVYGCLIMAGVAATLARPGRPSFQILTGLLLSAVILSRPEGLLPAGALFLARGLDPGTRHDYAGHRRVGLAMIAPALCYLGFRLYYFHEWLPNTWYAKKLPFSEAFVKGRWYMVQFVHENGGRWLYLPALFALFHRDSRRAVLVSGLVLAAYLPYVLIVGGDWMGQHRFLAPILPLLFYLVGTGLFAIVDPAVESLERHTGLMPLLRPAALLAAWLLLFVPTLTLMARERKESYVNADPYYTTIGRIVNAVTPRGASVATHDIGAVGWYGRRRVVDLLGLVDVDLARGKITADGLIAREMPEVLILHYDNRPGALDRWRKPDIPDFDSLYVRPTAGLPLPGSFFVRRDRAPFIAHVSAVHDMGVLAGEVADLNLYLEHRQPDGRSTAP